LTVLGNNAGLTPNISILIRSFASHSPNRSVRNTVPLTTTTAGRNGAKGTRLEQYVLVHSFEVVDEEVY